MNLILLAIIVLIPGGLLGFGAGYYFARRNAAAGEFKPAKTDKPAMPKKFRGATLAAALGASFAAGQGTFGHVIVEGEEPADSAGWECEVVGPALSGTRVCRPLTAVGEGMEIPESTPPASCEWRAESVGDVEVMRFICDEVEKE